MTKDEARSILPGGKWHEVAMKWVTDPAAVLQWRDHRGDWCIWTIHTAAPFAPYYEWRIKPRVLRYRVAIMRNLNNTLYPSIADSDLAAETLSGCHHFVKWAGDWRETEL